MIKKIDWIFKGFDYTELAEKWQIPIPERAGLDGLPEDYEYIQMYLYNFVGDDGNGNPTRLMRAVAKDIKAFMKALAEQTYNGDEPVWKGLSEVKYPYNVCRLFSPLVGHAWS